MIPTTIILLKDYKKLEQYYGYNKNFEAKLDSLIKSNIYQLYFNILIPNYSLIVQYNYQIINEIIMTNFERENKVVEIENKLESI